MGLGKNEKNKVEWGICLSWGARLTKEKMGTGKTGEIKFNGGSVIHGERDKRKNGSRKKKEHKVVWCIWLPWRGERRIIQGKIK